MKLLISGASGFVGSALTSRLQRNGHEVWRLVRREANFSQQEVGWNPDKNELGLHRVNGIEAVIHLSGANVASGPWTKSRRQEILESRTKTTALLARTLASLDQPPAVFISTSAVGYYGDRGDMLLDETATPGDGFLAEVCRAWEAAAEPARERGIRVVHPRVGLVLDRHGGILQKMLPPFRLGLGGKLGSGKQYLSWITLGDLLAAYEMALKNPALSGPVNFVSPEPVTNAEFTKLLGEKIHRPTVFSVPAALLKLLPGNMGKEMFLASTRAVPKKLVQSGFIFEAPSLSTALASLVGPTK